MGSNPTSSATKLKATLELQRLRFRLKRAIARLFYPVLSQRCRKPLFLRQELHCLSNDAPSSAAAATGTMKAFGGSITVFSCVFAM